MGITGKEKPESSKNINFTCEFPWVSRAVTAGFSQPLSDKFQYNILIRCCAAPEADRVETGGIATASSP